MIAEEWHERAQLRPAFQQFWRAIFQKSADIRAAIRDAGEAEIQ